MKRILSYMALAPLLLGFLSCNKFLDELPDKRAELDNTRKIQQLLVTAYPTQYPTAMFEIMSDNTGDNGPKVDPGSLGDLAREGYRWEPFTDTGWDDPAMVWGSCYEAISAANHALQAIEELNDPDATNGLKSEALLCRAFAHFVLVNTFCMAYNPQTSETDMGIPYAEKPETTPNPKYERGTVAGVYALIDKDITEAMGAFSDVHIATQKKFHFNESAAHAFAARFYLYYGKWDKVITHATAVLGTTATTFRDLTKYQDKTYSPDEWNLAYNSTDEPVNLMLIATRSLQGYANMRPERFRTIVPTVDGSHWQYFPWGGVVKGATTCVYGNAELTYVPKVGELWEITDPVAQTGQVHSVLAYFTTDETLACRAEAYVMLKQYDLAMADLNLWYAAQSPNGSTFSREQIKAYYSETRSAYFGNDGYVVPKMDSRFGVEAGDQKLLLCAVLAMRRYETLHMGLRFPDIKRHGIEIIHAYKPTDTSSEDLVLKSNDPRTAIQLPAAVISAGLPANPR